MPATRPRGRPRQRPYAAHDGRHVRLAASAARHALLVFTHALREEPGVWTYLEQHVPGMEGVMLGDRPRVIGMLWDVIEALAPPAPAEAPVEKAP